MIKNKRLFAAFSKCATNPTPENLSTVIHPDFVMIQSNLHPYGGAYRGIEGLQKFFGALHKNYAIDQLTMLALYENETADAMVIEFAVSGKIRGSEVSFGTTVMEKWRVQEGKIVEIKPHWFEPPAAS